MNRDSAVLSLEGICKSFGGLQVLEDVALSVNQDEIVGLIGPNGAGKTTLFNVITSIYKPDRGDVYLRGQKITGLAPHKICHMGISRTFQLIKTFLKMTVLENVMVGSIYGKKHQTREARKRALEALDLVEQNIHQALKIAHQAYVLKPGKVAISGRGDELLADEEIRKAYIGERAGKR